MLQEFKCDRDDSGRIPIETIVMKFSPDYDYPIAEFTDLEEAEEKFEIIKNFVDKYKF